ncbi:MAG: hypothetical protein ABSA54_03825 [Terriglobales bacterium]|jgi:hypothetical protein
MSASSISNSPPLSEYETISPAFAAALIAAGQLVYSHCKFHRNGKDVVYVFQDPLRTGEELQRRYTAGVFPLVHAKLLADVRNNLMDEANRIKGGRRANHKAL